jgi:hypothetical protein
MSLMLRHRKSKIGLMTAVRTKAGAKVESGVRGS